MYNPKTMTNENLKMRVLEAKKNLPKSGVTSLYFHYFKIKETDKAKTKLNNVLQLRSASKDITERLEKLAKLLTTN